MSNEKEIKKLKAVQAEFNGNWIDYGGINQAFEKAYQALEGKPQVEFAEKLKARIEESVCKRCQMNKHCELCEISRVFQIIELTAEEQKGGAE